MTWRLLDTGSREAAENMAFDEVLLEGRAGGRSPNTIRFLQFNNPTVLVGFHQSVAQEVRTDYCRHAGIEVNRRITGGGAIFFDPTQIGWEVIASRDDPRFRARPENLYRLLAEGAVRGLGALGVEASYRPLNDIEVNGRKISGTGGTERGGAFLFQGTLLVDFDVETMIKSLRLPAEKLKDKEIISFRERVTCLRDEVSVLPSAARIKECLARGLAEALDVELTQGVLNDWESRSLEEALPRFRSESWVEQVRRPPEDQRFLTATHKAPGGLIRIVMQADRNYRRIKQVFITGDFFAYPQRLVMDLEAAMKNASMDEDGLTAAVESFFERQAAWSIPGVETADFTQALVQAARKLDYPAFGLPEEAVNEVFTVRKPYGEIEGATALLLPYCAKPTWCEHRHRDSCEECGGCTVGDAYRLAREYGMRPITITNYEHLEETLNSLREEGVEAFVGSCCDPFHAKHQGDFERIGLTGVLVDIDNVTCYDLGEEKEAHQGRFDKETHLNLPLLEAVLKRVSSRSKEGKSS